MLHDDSPAAPKAGYAGWALSEESINELFEEALRSEGIGSITKFVDQICSLSRYALWNAFLISAQRPGALAVASAREWRQRYGRTIIPGASPIVILQTFGPVRLVYDVEDTAGPDLPGAPADLFRVVNKDGREVHERDLQVLSEAVQKKDAILVRRERYGTNLAGQAAALHASASGQTVGSSRQGVAFVVSVAKRFAPAEALATLAHELAHIYCGHLGRPVVIDAKTKKRKQLHWSDRSSGLTQGQREFEAEATAYLVCRRIGLETRSADYLAGYLSTTDRDHISYAAIIRAAARIEALMPSGLAPVAPKSAELGPSQTQLFPGWYGWSVHVAV